MSNVGMLAGTELTDELTEVKKKADLKPLLSEPNSRLPPAENQTSVYSTFD
jgi:hypothetical protein